MALDTPLDRVLAKAKSENRAALIAYIPAGFPSHEGCKKVIAAFAEGGVDAIEIGFPYSDPVMDGPTIQAAAVQSLSQGTGAKEVFESLQCAHDHGVAAVVMTYWSPIASDFRLPVVTSKCGGFVYAASMMGVTGTRTSVSSSAAELVARVRTTTDTPISVGLGVSTREQARSVAGYADGVIVGSAFINALMEAPDEASGLRAVKELAQELALGVREGR